jgi:ubiquinone/menaquinone biosynthesis C-methylase UbiE
MTSTLRDHFSQDPRGYGRYRPHYPPALFAHLASLTRSHACAWDCATGSGQAAVSLAEYYATVIATDASAAQISRAAAHPRVTYAVRSAQDSGLDTDSSDLVTVAQALHWFDIADFSAEATRVLRPGGIIAAWTYNLMRVTGALDTIIERFYSSTLHADWPSQRRLVETGYREIEMPIRELVCPPFQMAEDWTFERLLGYLNTWSAVKRYSQRTGESPMVLVADDLRAAWGDPANVRRITWPLQVRIWQT